MGARLETKQHAVSSQLMPTVPEDGYCLGEMMTFMLCSRRVGIINDVAYDALEWTVGADHNQSV